MAFAELTGSNLYNLSATFFFFLFKGLGKLLHCTALQQKGKIENRKSTLAKQVADDCADEDYDKRWTRHNKTEQNTISGV